MSGSTMSTMLTFDRPSRPPRPPLVVRDTITGPHLREFGVALEDAVRSGGGTLIVDVSDLDEWSLLAQAMILSTARRLARRGEQLVLVGPSQTLRTQSRRMDVFGRVTTRDARQRAGTPPLRS